MAAAVKSRTDPDITRAAAQQLKRLVSPELLDLSASIPTLEVAGTQVLITREMVEILAKAAEMLSAGQSVELVSLTQELSAQEAAMHLGVSRPYVINLLRKGILPHRMVGAHHRIPLADVLAYKESQAPRRAAALANLARETDELGH